MDTFYTRTSALQFATTLGHKDADSLVKAADAINNFLAAAPLEANGLVSSALGGALNAQQSTTEVQGATSPKETRKRRTTASGAAEKESAPSTTATNATEADASTAKSDPATDDLFGEEAAPEVKEEKAKKLTIDDVKVALVAVQTALKHKDHALALLSKHTVPKGEKVLSKLPEANYAALIKEADSAIKAGKVTP